MRNNFVFFCFDYHAIALLSFQKEQHLSHLPHLHISVLFDICLTQAE